MPNYPLNYERIITPELFERCQEVRLGYHKKPFKYGAKPFLFRGLLHCAECGCAFSAERKKQKYTYLRPTKTKGLCDCATLREEVITEQLEGAFKSLHVSEPLLAKLKDHLKQSASAEQDFHTAAIAQLQKDYNTVSTKLHNALDMRLEGSITKEEYDAIVPELRAHQEDLNRRLQRHTKADEQFAMTVNRLLELASRAYDLFLSSEMDEKRQLIGFVFSNLQIRGKNLEYSMRKPFDAMANARTYPEWLSGGIDVASLRLVSRCCARRRTKVLIPK